MKQDDIRELILMCEEALVELNRYEATGDSTKVFGKIRSIGNVCLNGDIVAPFLKENIPLRLQHNFENAIFALRGLHGLSGGKNSNLQRKEQLMTVKDIFQGILEKLSKSKKDSIKIFYSWQSSLPNSTNRGFIKSCIEKTLKEINNDISLESRVSIDSDTINVPGSPDIINTILNKIDNSDIFIADVSIIDNNVPNANVMLELGYALKSLETSKVLMLFNDAYGSTKNLPFDLGFKRQIIYNVSENDEKAEKRKELSNRLKKAFEEIIRNI